MRMSGEERRKQILDVALKLCARKGFSGTTLDDVAHQAGISRALVIEHFGSKKGLYRALSEAVGHAHRLDEDAEVERRMEEKDDYGVFRACAEHVFENNLRNAKASNLRLTIFSMLENPELFQQFRGVRDEAWEGVISYVEAREREGALRSVDARNLVEGFRSLVAHQANEVMHEKDPPDQERFYAVVDTVLSLLLRGLQAPRRPVGRALRVSSKERLDRLPQRQRI
jgi:AcrR family transcriptional regulator